MLEALRAAVVKPIVERWLLRSRSSWRRLPVPSGPPAARSEGPDPDRILLLGSGIAAGYGVTTHDLALAGQLARQVSALTRRGVQLDVIPDENLVATMSLTVRRLRELDMVIATPGAFERLMLMPTSLWRHQVERFLDHFAVNAPASLQVLVVAVPEVSKIVRMPWLLGVLADRSARSLNATLEASCSRRPYAEFIPFRPTERAGRAGTGRTYRQWAELIAPRVARSLERHHRVSA